MILSRIILAVLLLILGGMVFGVNRSVERLTDEVARMDAKVDTMQFMADMKLQTAIGWIGKPRVPPIRHVYRKSPAPLCGC